MTLHRSRFIFLAVLMLWLAYAPVATAQHETWSTEYGLPGPSGMATAMVLLGDSLILATGHDIAGGVSTTALALWDGDDWYAFAEPIDGYVIDLEVGPDGALYAAGAFTLIGGVEAQNVARFDPQSGRWQALGGGVDGRVVDLAVNDENVFVVGDFTSAGGVPARGIARYEFASGAWSGIGLGGEAGSLSIAFLALADSALYVGGRFESIGDIAAHNVARYDVGSETWSALGPGVSGLFVMEVLDGNLYVANPGGVGGIPVGGLARWDGEAWSAVGTPNPDASPVSVRDIAGGPDGDVYIIGGFSSYDFWSVFGVPADGVARWDGETWHAVGNGLPWEGSRIVAGAANGETLLYVGGETVFIPERVHPINFLRRLDGSAWKPVGSDRHGGVSGHVLSVTSHLDRLCIGGAFTFAGVHRTNNVACRRPGGPWESLVGGANGPVFEVTFAPDGTLYAGGFFSIMGDATARGVAAWDGESWRPLGDGPGNSVHTLSLMPDGQLVAGGSFGVRIWNGAGWSPLDDEDWEGTTYSLVVGVDGIIYAGGEYQKSDGVAEANVLQWNGSTWTPLEGLGSLPVTAMVWGPDGFLYAGGAFEGVWYWDGQDWVRLGEKGSQPHDIYALASDGTTLLAGGSFFLTGATGESRNLARWTGSQWKGVAGGIDGTAVRALDLSESDVYVGGIFRTVGGPSERIPSVGVAHLSGVAVSVAEGAAPNSDSSFSPVGPNPFRERTGFRLEHRVAGNVRVIVYDVLGRQVTALLDEYLSPGSYDVYLEAGHLAAGSYIVVAHHIPTSPARIVQLVR